jgi:short-subunit dehydrogenase
MTETTNPPRTPKILNNMTSRLLDRNQFGPWALITGASSGIGREFARLVAASGIHVVLVARRECLLLEVGKDCSDEFGIEHRIVVADLSADNFMSALVGATRGFDIGLVISNAGTANPGRFLEKGREELIELLRLNTLAHLELAHHFGHRLLSRGVGGILFVGAMGADKGIPLMANDAAAKSYVKNLSVALHSEFKPAGVHVTLLAPGATETPVLAKFGFSPKTMPMKPMSARRCAEEGLTALAKNRRTIIPGRMNRILNAFVPAAVTRELMARMLAKSLAAKAGPSKANLASAIKA